LRLAGSPRRQDSHGIGYALLLGFGMVLVIEGLAFALAPRRMEDLCAFLPKFPSKPAA
jgi:uncharacterized protein YjeT (DUF2065 family)